MNTYKKYLSKMRIKSHSALSATILLIAIGIASVAMPDIPQWITTLFNNTIFKIFYMTTVLIIFSYCPLTALLIALIFLIIVQSINKFISLRNSEPNDNHNPIPHDIVQSIADTSSEIVSDAGDIYTGIRKGIKHYVIREDSFNNLIPVNVIDNNNFPDTISEKNDYFDKTEPQPLPLSLTEEIIPGIDNVMRNNNANTNANANANNIMSQAGGDKMGSYIKLDDLYHGRASVPQFPDITPEKNNYFDKKIPMPLSLAEEIIPGIDNVMRNNNKNIITQAGGDDGTGTYIKLDDLYHGRASVPQFPDITPEKNNYFDKITPKPFTEEIILEEGIQPFVDMPLVPNYNPLKDRYTGKRYTEQYKKYEIEPSKENNYFNYLVKPFPQPLNQSAVFPK